MAVDFDESDYRGGNGVKGAGIQIIPNPYCPEGVIVCSPKDSGLLRAELDRLRTENERLQEVLRYYASLKWFVNDGEYIYKRAEDALSVRGQDEI